MKTIEDYDFEGKRVLLRVDFNVPLDEQCNIKDDSRIRAALPTIRYVLDNGATQLIIMSHLGDPGSKPVASLKLDPIERRLSELLEKTVYKTKDCLVKRMPAEKIVLLENLRFHPEEAKNDETFAKTLAGYADFYVNDAFGVSHRAHASVHAITRFIPGCIGLLMKTELANLDISKMQHPIVAIIGGAKLRTKIPLIQRMLVKADKVLIGGGMIFTFYKSNGWGIGESVLDTEYVKNAQVMMHNENLILPSDVVVADCQSKSINIRTVTADLIPDDSVGLDIGQKSIDTFKEHLSKAATVIWNGPLGYYEKAPFDYSTVEMAKFIANLDCVKIIGGGDTADAIHKLGMDDKFTFISSGGGAALEILSGQGLVALEALENSEVSQ